MVISGENVCCSMVFDTLSGWYISIMWSELLIKSAVSWPLWSSVYECQRAECALTSLVRTECVIFVMW